MKEKTAELKEKIEKDYKDMMAVINSTSLPLFVEDTIEDMHILIETLIAENKELKEKNKKAKEFIEENSHEIYCKRDELIELEFDDNTNATDLIDILEGNY